MSGGIIRLQCETKIPPVQNRDRNGYTVYVPQRLELQANTTTKLDLGIVILKFEPRSVRVCVSLHKKLVEKGLLSNDQILKVLLKFQYLCKVAMFQKCNYTQRLHMFVFNGTGEDIVLAKGQKVANLEIHPSPIPFVIRTERWRFFAGFHCKTAQNFSIESSESSEEDLRRRSRCSD